MAISSMPETGPRVSRLLADIDGLALDDHHWLVIRSIHEHFGHFNSMPISKVLRIPHASIRHSLMLFFRA